MAQIDDTMSASTSAAISSTVASTEQISQSNYECSHQLKAAQASQSANTIMHESTSGISSFITFSDKPWVLNS